MRIVTAIIFTLLSFSLSGQTFKQYVKAADKSMNIKDYYSAMMYYKNALEIKSDKADIHYKCGKAAKDFFAYTIAEEHLMRASKLANEGEFPLLSLYLGEVKQTLGKYSEAAEFYTAYFNAGVGSEMNLEKADMERDACQWAANQKRDEEIMTQHLDKVINSKFSEFGGSWSEEGLVYSSLKFKDESVKHDRRLSKVLSTVDVEERGRTIRIKGSPKEVSIANATFNDKEDLMFFTACSYLNAIELQCDIYYAQYDGKRWSAAKLDDPINLEGYTQTQPSWSEHAGWRGLFFSSDRPDGVGGMDIWFSAYKGGDVFAEPINVKKVNTSFDEISPSTDNGSSDITLYFSSDGYVGFGQYDVYQSDLVDNEWTDPENMGMPINSGYNDVYFWRNSKMDKALVSSNRPESRSMIKGDPACCNDLYAISFPKKKEKPKTEPIPVPMEEPIVKVEIEKPRPKPQSKPIVIPPPKPNIRPEPEVKPTPNPKPVPVIVEKPQPKPVPQPVTIKPTPVVTIQKLLPLKVYFDNDEPDKRTTKTKTNKTYAESYEAYMAREPVFYDKYLQGIEVDNHSVAMNNLINFFNSDVRQGFSDLQTVSYMILNKLNNGKSITIEIKGYTSPRAKSDYNKYLAQRRTSSLINHFHRSLDGSFLPFIRNGQLKLVELPLGESQAPTNVSDSLVDEKKSIYSPEASKERRAEIVAVKIE